MAESIINATGTAGGSNIRITNGSYKQPSSTYSLLNSKAGKKYFEETKYSDWFGKIGEGVGQMVQARAQATDSLLLSNNSIVSSINNQMNANRLLINNDIINRNTQQQLSKIQFENANLKSQQKEIESASGFEVSSGSYQDMEQQADFVAAQTTAALIAENAMQIASNKYQMDTLNLKASMDFVNAGIEKKKANATKRYGMASGMLTSALGMAGAGFKGA